MQAIQISAPGQIEFTLLNSTALKHGEVRIEVALSAICGSDLKNIQNPNQIPMIPGHEFSGRIIEVAEGTNKLFKLGDRVTVFPMISCMNCEQCLAERYRDCDKKLAIGFNIPGSFASEVRVDSRFVIGLHDNISYEQGALLEHLCCGYRLTQEIIATKKSNKSQILIIGDGPIALADLQFLKNANFTNVTVIGRRKNRLNLAVELGATHVVCSEDPDFLEGIKAFSFDICIFAAPADDVLYKTLKYFKEDVIIYPQTRIKKESILNYLSNNKISVGRAFAYFMDDFKKVMELILIKQIKTKELISKKMSYKEYVDSFLKNNNAKERAKILLINDSFGLE